MEQMPNVSPEEAKDLGNKMDQKLGSKTEKEQRREKISRRGAALLGLKIMMGAMAAAGQAKAEDASKTIGNIENEQTKGKVSEYTLSEMRSMSIDDLAAQMGVKLEGDPGSDDMPNVETPDSGQELKKAEETKFERRGLADLGEIDFENSEIVDEGDHYTIELNMDKMMAADENELEMKGKLDLSSYQDPTEREMAIKEMKKQGLSDDKIEELLNAPTQEEGKVWTDES